MDRYIDIKFYRKNFFQPNCGSACDGLSLMVCAVRSCIVNLSVSISFTYYILDSVSDFENDLAVHFIADLTWMAIGCCGISCLSHC